VNIFLRKFSFLFWMALILQLSFGARTSFAQWSENFTNYTLDSLVFHGWDLGAGWALASGTPVTFGVYLLSSDLPLSTGTPFQFTTGFFHNQASTARTVSFQYTADYPGNISDLRRAQFRVSVINQSGSTIWTSAYQSVAEVKNTITDASINIPAAAFPNLGWYRLRMEVTRSSAGTGGTSTIRFDNFGGTIPTNGSWPKLSPKFTQNPRLSIDRDSIPLGEKGELRFRYQHTVDNSLHRVRNMRYQLTIPARFQYESHTFTGSGFSAATNYNSTTKVLTVFTNSATPDFTLRITGEVVGSCTCPFTATVLSNDQPYDGAINDPVVDAVLPVELMFFKANANQSKGSVQLSWATASEKNNAFFTIERTRNGRDFETIGMVDGAGDHSGYKEYLFEDTNPFDGTTYYRLKQTDFDEKFSVSELVRVNFKSLVSRFMVYPNPLQKGSVLYVKLNKPEQFGNLDTELQVHNSMGQLIYTNKISTPLSDQVLEINAENLATGLYIISLKSAGHTEIQKLYKK
jgi:hypothetical protein